MFSTVQIAGSGKKPKEKFHDRDFTFNTTGWGTTRSYVYPDGTVFSEFRSHSNIFGLPFLHRTRGKNPQTGRLVVAKGVVAIGRIAIGLLAIGQIALGLLAIGQAAVGVAFCLGQAAMGITAIGQVAVGGLFGFGQIATGALSVGQVAIGWFSYGQFALHP